VFALDEPGVLALGEVGDDEFAPGLCAAGFCWPSEANNEASGSDCPCAPFAAALCGHIDWKSANGLLLFDPTDNDMLRSSQRQMEAAASFPALRCKTGAER
jgi:hypothetical protein